MSDYGADENPNIPAAQDLAFTKGFMPLAKSNVMQWTYPNGVVVRKLANKQDKSNILFKMKPESVPAGDPCLICWGIDKPFGPGQTPGTVTVVIEGVEKTPAWLPFFGEPPNGTFELTQKIEVACTYEFDDANFDMDLVYTLFIATFVVQRTGTPFRSFSDGGPICSTFFQNLNPPGFAGGTATIFIPPVE